MKRMILVLGLLMLMGWSGAARGDSTEVRHKFAVRVAGAWDIVRGSDESILHSGVGYNLQLMVPICRSFAIIGNYGRSGEKMDDLPQYGDTSYTTYASDLKISSYRYSAGLRFTSRSFFGWKKMRFVMDVTAGKLHYETGGRVLIEDSTGRAGNVWRPRPHDPDLLAEWETGLQLRVSSNTAAELGIRRYLSFYPADGGSSSMDVDYGFCFGVTVGVGRKK